MTLTSDIVPVAPTRRERELIALIARGLPNKAIAYEMNISANTVRAHIGNIMRKYKVYNRTQIAIILASQLQELEGPLAIPTTRRGVAEGLKRDR